MKRFFKQPLKVSFWSLIFTFVVLSVLLIDLEFFSNTDSDFVYTASKVYIAIALPVLIVNPLFGLIYSFFVEGYRKIIFILLHFASAGTISIYAFLAFMFRYFVPFAP
ncbi:hypothetical protein GLW08_16730 [Pontibacillus yanchengensis]|uniref:Uncharacterized protein n=1 Tax=Pontibacillus yanchengensis TaxID=462910 RepID=A0ACC7VJ54_9BACI|nr:hypothetical protein [Pontibacillus yanchengensis]MYL54981.1 hypothetical protein [Pontibacillus yanchengensis]